MSIIDPYSRPEEEDLSPNEFDAEAIRVFDVQGVIESATIDHLYAHENPKAWEMIRERDGEERFAELRALVAETYTVPLPIRQV